MKTQFTLLTDPMIQPKPPDTSQLNTPAFICACAPGANDMTASASATAPIALDINPSLARLPRPRPTMAPTREPMLPVLAKLGHESPTAVRRPTEPGLIQGLELRLLAYFRFPQKRWMRRQASSRTGVATA